jgi:biotin-(acetyl-CoA carboxylase) ligase
LRKETGRLHSRLEILVKLLSQFETDYNRFLREGAGYVVQRFELVSSFANGKRVKVDTGRETFVGTTEGLSAEGLLMVKKEDGGSVTVIAGDVTEER